MMALRSAPMLGLMTLALAGCDTEMPGDAQTAAEAACVEAVDQQMGRRGAEVMASETSASGTRVLVLSDDGRTWSCSASNAGTIESLSLA